MTDPVIPAALDGFRVEIDTRHERADVILDRPRFNVITMAQREQLRAVFEGLDADDHVRIVVVRAIGEHFSSGGEIRDFLEASPEHVSHLAWNIAAPARCRKPVIAASRGIVLGSASNWRSPAISAWSLRRVSMRCRSSGSAKFPAPVGRRACRR
jgi:2-oxoglutaroyl-CoA hydrolase